MSKNEGSRVVAPLVPYDTEDPFATHDDQYGKGGYRSVATLDERNAITAERRRIGMLVHVQENGITYRLTDDLASWDDTTVSTGTDLGMARDATTVTVENSTGTDAVLPAATTSLAGVMTAADKVSLAAKQPKSIPVDDAGSNRDLALTDVYVKFVRMTSASANTVTMTLAVLGTLADGDEVSGIQAGAGQTTLTPGAGVTFNATPGLKTRARYSPWTIKRISSTECDVFGDLAA